MLLIVRYILYPGQNSLCIAKKTQISVRAHLKLIANSTVMGSCIRTLSTSSRCYDVPESCTFWSNSVPNKCQIFLICPFQMDSRWWWINCIKYNNYNALICYSYKLRVHVKLLIEMVLEPIITLSSRLSYAQTTALPIKSVLYVMLSCDI